MPARFTAARADARVVDRHGVTGAPGVESDARLALRQLPGDGLALPGSSELDAAGEACRAHAAVQPREVEPGGPQHERHAVRRERPAAFDDARRAKVGAQVGEFDLLE